MTVHLDHGSSGPTQADQRAAGKDRQNVAREAFMGMSSATFEVHLLLLMISNRLNNYAATCCMLEPLGIHLLMKGDEMSFLYLRLSVHMGHQQDSSGSKILL